MPPKKKNADTREEQPREKFVSSIHCPFHGTKLAQQSDWYELKGLGLWEDSECTHLSFFYDSEKRCSCTWIGLGIVKEDRMYLRILDNMPLPAEFVDGLLNHPQEVTVEFEDGSQTSLDKYRQRQRRPDVKTTSGPRRKKK